VARTLLGAGWTDVRALVGGFDAWRTAGYPVEAKTDGGSRSVDTPLSIKEIQDNLQKAEGDETDEA
jgi:3-mercaptopyruvate sulfurtransferase SseA